MAESNLTAERRPYEESISVNPNSNNLLPHLLMPQSMPGLQC